VVHFVVDMHHRCTLLQSPLKDIYKERRWGFREL